MVDNLRHKQASIHFEDLKKEKKKKKKEKKEIPVINKIHHG